MQIVIRIENIRNFDDFNWRVILEPICELPFPLMITKKRGKKLTEK